MNPSTVERSDRKDFSFQNSVSFPGENDKDVFKKGNDRKSIGSKTATTAMTSSNGSLLHRQKFKDDWNDLVGFPEIDSLNESLDSENDDRIAKDDISVDDSAVMRRSKSNTPAHHRRKNTRAKSEPRHGKNKFKNKAAALPELDSFDPLHSGTPSSSRRYRSNLTDPRARRGLIASSPRDSRRSRRNEIETDSDRYFSSSRKFSSDRNSHYSDYLSPRGSGGMSRNRTYGNDSRYSRSDTRHMYKNDLDDFDERNYKENLEDKMDDLLSLLENGEDPGSKKNEKVSKILTSLHRRNKKLENENMKLRNALENLSRSAHRQDDAVEYYRVKEQDHYFDLKEKDDIIVLLEREKDELRHFLLESQLENKVYNKKCDLLRKKVTDLELAFARHQNRATPNAVKPEKMIIIESKSADHDDGSISSLET